MRKLAGFVTERFEGGIFGIWANNQDAVPIEWLNSGCPPGTQNSSFLSIAPGMTSDFLGRGDRHSSGAFGGSQAKPHAAFAGTVRINLLELIARESDGDLRLLLRGEFVTTLKASALQYVTAVRGAHAHSEAVRGVLVAVVRLIRTLHCL